MDAFSYLMAVALLTATCFLSYSSNNSSKAAAFSETHTFTKLVISSNSYLSRSSSLYTIPIAHQRHSRGALSWVAGQASRNRSTSGTALHRLLLRHHSRIAKPNSQSSLVPFLTNDIVTWVSYTLSLPPKKDIMKSRKRKLLNYSLLILGVCTCLSGVIMQLEYHIGVADRSAIAHIKHWGMNYSQWQITHHAVASLFFILSAIHVYLHRRWYKGVISKRLYKRNGQLLTDRKSVV